jgi:hypothetical protein
MRARALLLGLLGGLFVLVSGAGQAGAATAVYGDVCGSLGSPAFCTAGEFSVPIGVAVDNSANPSSEGDVYVADLGNRRVVRFDAAGKELSVIQPPGGFTNPIWDAVDPSNGDLYVSDYEGGVVDKFNPAGELVAGFGTGGQLTGFSFTAGVAVDPSNGNLFVAQRGAPVIDEFDSSGSLLGSFSAPVESNADSIAVDSEGNVYAVDEKLKLVKYPAGNRAEPTVLDSNAPFAVAVDPSTNDVYVERNTGLGPEIVVYDSAGTLLSSSFGLGDFSGAGSAGLAVNATAHAVYATDIENNHGLIFEEGEPPEAPATEAAGEVRGNSAMLHGTLNPGGAGGALEYHFDYNAGATCTGGSSVPVPAAKVAEAKTLAVEAQATGLLPRTEYTFCLVAANPFGSVSGSEVSLTTVAGKPVVEAESSPGQTTSGAQVTAQINPSGAATTCKVQYGTEVSYGSEMPCPEGLGEGLSGQPASVTLTGLQPNKTYHYRFLAANVAGEGEGEGTDQTFKTLMVAPVTDQAPTASSIGRVSVHLSGTVNPENVLVFYHFIYGTTAKYGSSTPVTEGGTGLGDEQVSQQLEGLAPGTTYHYALVIANPAGGETSADRTFTTSPPTPPAAVTGTASSTAPTSATLSGTVDPNSLPTTYTFEIGTDTSYGGELSGVAGSDSESAATATFNNLQPATIYHYRLLAINQDGTSYGQDMTFTTPGFPSSLTVPVSPLLIPIPSIAFPTETGATKEPQRHPQKKKKKKAKTRKHRKQVRHGRKKNS